MSHTKITVFSFQHGEAKRRKLDHDHTHRLSGLLGQSRDDSSTGSVKHVPQRRRQGWLSGSEEARRTAASQTFRRFLAVISMAFRRSLLWGFARRRLLASCLGCHAACIPASMPGPAHRRCAPRGCLERGSTSSVAVESMTSAMSVATSLV